MKKITLICLAVAVSAGLMAQSVYEKVTTSPADWAGTYLIVSEAQQVVFNGAAGAADIDAKGGAAILQTITISDNIIEGTAELDAATFTIAATGDANWPWSIQSASGLFIGHKDTLDNGLSTEEELKGKCKHTLSIDAAGNLIATPKYTNNGPYNLQYNKKSDQLRFRYFQPQDKEAIQLYRKHESSTSLHSTAAAGRSTKRIENGQLVILRNGKRFNALGAEL